MTSNRETIDRILEDHGRTFAEEPGLNIVRNRPSPPFRPRASFET